MRDEPEVRYGGVPRSGNAAERRDEELEDGAEEGVENKSIDHGEDVLGDGG